MQGVGMLCLAIAPGGFLIGQPVVTAIYLALAAIGLAGGRALILVRRGPRP